MVASRYNNYSELGIGVGLRVPHYDFILENSPEVGWFEIISENFMADGGRPLKVLEEIVDKYTVVQHGVSLYLGSTDALNLDYLKKLKRLVQKTSTPFLSDHLCWGSFDGSFTHDLLPLPYTKSVAAFVAERIRYVQDYLELPLCVENISSYGEFKASDMTEWQFLSEVVELADCGILLDVNNVFVSSQNHDFDPLVYINSIPLERVGQIHIAGHSKQEACLIDTHDRAVCDEVWNLYREVVARVGPINTLLEWDSDLPSFEELLKEASKANAYLGVLGSERLVENFNVI
jgi:uncharacterized protein (UPF0276 family)